ncbi:hypothetical protein ACP4OV_007731 [Aristida adscensionis]
MEDSSLFMQWALSTLQQQQQPPAAAVADAACSKASFPSLQALREASQAAEMVRELMVDAPTATNSWSSGSGDGDGDTTDGNNSAAAAIDQDAWPLTPSSGSSGSGGGGGGLPVSWNFGAATAQQPGSDGAGVVEVAAAPRCPPELAAYGSPPPRRAGSKSSGSMSSAPYAQDHIMAERKRREKINQRFIELSTVIPGLKKMDKATILSDATKYVRELQEKVKELEARRSNNRRSIIEPVVLVKRPCLHAVAVPNPDDDGSTLSASSAKPAAAAAARKQQLPEIEARFSETSVMVRIHCENGKGVAVKMLSEVENLHLSIVHANVMPFQACTLIMTITAKMAFVLQILEKLHELEGQHGVAKVASILKNKNSRVEDGFSVTAEEIVGRLNSVLLHQHSSCKDTEEQEN